LLQRSLTFSHTHKVYVSFAPTLAALVKFYILKNEFHKSQCTIDEWLPILEKSCPHDPRISRVYYMYANLCRELGETEKSIDLYKKGLKISQFDGTQTLQAYGLCMLGYQLKQEGETTEEYQVNQTFIKLTTCPSLIPVSDSLDVYRAKWLLSRGDDETFIQWYQAKEFDLVNTYTPYYEKAYLLYARYLYLNIQYAEIIIILSMIELEA